MRARESPVWHLEILVEGDLNKVAPAASKGVMPVDHPIRILMINPNSDENTCALIRKTVERFPKNGCVVDFDSRGHIPKHLCNQNMYKM